MRKSSYGSVEVAPLPPDLQIRLVHVPLSAPLTAAPFPQLLSQKRSKACPPLPNRLMGKGKPTFQEHLRKASEREVVRELPKNHEQHDIGRKLEKVVRRPRSLVKRPTTTTTAVAFIAELGGLIELRRAVAAAVGAGHPERLTCASKTSSARTASGITPGICCFYATLCPERLENERAYVLAPSVTVRFEPKDP